MTQFGVDLESIRSQFGVTCLSLVIVLWLKSDQTCLTTGMSDELFQQL